MFKLIGGINTAGKTMYLEDLYLSDAASYNFIGYDNRVLVILDLLCRCDRNILVDVIAATHDIQLTSYGDKYYTVTSDMFVVDLQEITEEEYRNIV